MSTSRRANFIICAAVLAVAEFGTSVALSLPVGAWTCLPINGTDALICYSHLFG